MTATSATDAPSVASRRKEVRRVVLSSYLGSTIEFYDLLQRDGSVPGVRPDVLLRSGLRCTPRPVNPSRRSASSSQHSVRFPQFSSS